MIDLLKELGTEKILESLKIGNLSSLMTEKILCYGCLKGKVNAEKDIDEDHYALVARQLRDSRPLIGGK